MGMLSSRYFVQPVGNVVWMRNYCKLLASFRLSVIFATVTYLLVQQQIQ